MSDLAFYLVQSDLLTDPKRKLQALHHLWGAFLDWGGPDKAHDSFLGLSTSEMKQLAPLVFEQLKVSGLLGITARTCRARLHLLVGKLSFALPMEVVRKELVPINNEFCRRSDELYGTRLDTLLPVFSVEGYARRFFLDGLVTRDVLSPDPRGD